MASISCGLIGLPNVEKLSLECSIIAELMSGLRESIPTIPSSVKWNKVKFQSHTYPTQEEARPLLEDLVSLEVFKYFRGRLKFIADFAERDRRIDLVVGLIPLTQEYVASRWAVENRFQIIDEEKIATQRALIEEQSRVILNPGSDLQNLSERDRKLLERRVKGLFGVTNRFPKELPQIAYTNYITYQAEKNLESAKTRALLEMLLIRSKPTRGVD